MSFISLQPRLALRDLVGCHWFAFRTRHTCPLALVDWSQIVLPVVNHGEISQWDERGQAWRVCSPQVWLRSTFQYVHTCQLLWYSAAPRKTSVDHSLSPFLLRGPTQREKEIAPVSVAQISDFLPMLCVSSILSESMPLPSELRPKPRDHCIVVAHYRSYCAVFPGPHHSCISLCSLICGALQVQAVAWASPLPPPPPPSAEPQIICTGFLPSGDHKASTRMCVKCSVVLSGMQASLSFSLLPFSFCLSTSAFIPCSGSLYLSPPPHSLSTVFLSTDSNSVCLGQVWEGRFAAFTGLKLSRAAHAVITCRRVCACVEAESQQPPVTKLLCVASHL